MKTKILITITALFAVFLTGCQETETEKTNTPSNVNVNVPEASNETVTKLEPGAEADKSAYEGAVKLLDRSFCEKIQDQSLKNQCEIEVNDTTYKKDALDQVKPEICEKLSTDDKKESCKTDIEVRTQLNSNKEKELSDVDAYNKIIQEASYDKCSTLTSPDLLELCENNQIFYEAVSNKNVSLCETLPEEKLIKECNSYYEANISN